MMGERFKSLPENLRRTIDRALGMEYGYVLDFSNRTFRNFVEDRFGFDIYSNEFNFLGDSKAKRLRALLSYVDDKHAAQILVEFWKYRTTLPDHLKLDTPDAEERIKSEYFECVEHLQRGEKSGAILNAISKFDQSETLDHLINSIERDVRSDRYPAALDRLHTYCMRRFRVLLEDNGNQVDEAMALHARAGSYARVLESKGFSQTTVRIIKSSISIFESLNDVRNKKSLAHDNDLLSPREARFILDSVGAVLRFLESVRSHTKH